MDDVTCPYCNEEFEVNHDDGAHYKDGEEQEDSCPHCEKRILIYSSCTWNHEARAADCLNGELHPWSEWRDLWVDEEKHPGKKYQRRYCMTCNEDQMEWRDV